MRAWTGETFSYSGKAWNYEEIILSPATTTKASSADLLRRHSPESPAMVARRSCKLALSRQP